MIAEPLVDGASGYRLRIAVGADIETLERLIARSAAALSAGYYDKCQIDAAIAHVFGVDSDLLADGSYFVIESADAPVACGGWSRRRTLFGGDAFVARDSGLLDPRVDAAKIRAFFVDPDHARRGLAGRLLAASEAAAAAAGFARVELMATLPGVPFYRAAGFVAGHTIAHPAGDILVPFVPMTKTLANATGHHPGQAREGVGRD